MRETSRQICKILRPRSTRYSTSATLVKSALRVLVLHARTTMRSSERLKYLVQSSIRIVPWRLRTWIKEIPLIAPLQRFILATFLEGHEFIHTIDAGPARGLIYPVMLPDDKGVWTG